MIFFRTVVLTAGLVLAVAAASFAAEPTAPDTPAAAIAATAASAPEQAADSDRPVASPPGDAGIVAEITASVLDQLTRTDLPVAKADIPDRLALKDFYDARNGAPLWVTADGLTGKAEALMAEIANAAAYGLDPKGFVLPAKGTPKTAEALGIAEYRLSIAALAYARDARGGRIPDPASMLNSNLDRKPQLHEPKDVLQKLALAEASDVATVLTSLHPVHPQFEKLRQAFLKETGGDGRGKLSSTAKRLRANMEFWRWMWDDLGELYVFNNIPEFMQYVVKNGSVVRKERIVVGETGKQSSVFSRPLKEVVLRPRWRVPESIMVYELWPSLRKGGGLMRRYGLEITTKSGQERDWRTIDWSHDDIRNYHVWQPPGGKSVLGFVKFSFPSQHTIFMHDTPDKWMFNSRQRTLSHGCLRVKNPMELAEIVLDYDRGWDRTKIKQLAKTGPLDNNLEMTRHIPIHLAYFTAWADDKGKVTFFKDIYGHEKRVTQALDGDWKKINKGRNHLAKPQPRFSRDQVASDSASPGKAKKSSGGNVADLIADALGF